MAEHECRFCGAELPPPDEDGRMRCGSCGRHTSVEEPEPARITVVVEPAPIRPERIRVVLPLVLMVGAALVIGLVVARTVSRTVDLMPGGSRDPSIGPLVIGAVVPEGSGEATDPIVVAIVQEPDGDGLRRILRAFRIRTDGTARTLWTGPELHRGAAHLQAAVVGDTVQVVVSETLFSLNLADGGERWRHELSDGPAPSCGDRCLVVVDGGVAVRTADGRVTVLGTDDPDPVLRLDLEEPTAGVLSRGGDLIVLDTADGEVVVDTIGIGTGEVTNRVHLGGDRGVTDLSDHRILPIPGSEDLVVLGGFHTQRAWRIDPEDPEPRWRTELTRLRWRPDAPVALDPTRLILGGGEEGDAVRLELDTGAEVLLDGDEGATVSPLFLDDGILISTTVTGRGTPRGGFRVWDLSRVEEVLDVDVEPRMTWYGGDGTAGGVVLFEGETTGVLLGDRRGLVLVRFSNPRDRDRTPTLSVQSIDPMTGDLGPEHLLALDPTTGSKRIEILTTDGPLVFLEDGSLRWFDPRAVRPELHRLEGA